MGEIFVGRRLRTVGVHQVTRNSDQGRSDVLTTTIERIENKEHSESVPSVDELDLFRAYVASRDISQRNALVERYMGLAAHIAKRYKRPGNDDDIRQAAMIGLVKAVDRFDPDFGVSFGAFAGTTIGAVSRDFC